MPESLSLVAIITVRRAALASFRAFETQAVRIMAEHGGRIERTVVVAEDAQPETIKEIHIVTFPDEAAFAAYRNDARLGPYAHLRAESVMHSEILVGTEGPVYSAG